MFTLKDGHVARDKNFGESIISQKNVVEDGKNKVESDIQGVHPTKISNNLPKDYNPMGNYVQHFENSMWGSD